MDVDAARLADDRERRALERLRQIQAMANVLRQQDDTASPPSVHASIRSASSAAAGMPARWGSLEILDKIGYLVRERFKIWGQVQALTGEGRLSGIVLLALPPVLFLAVYRLNPEYVTPLFTDPMGRQMLAGGIVMQLLGAIVIKKIINIKV